MTLRALRDMNRQPPWPRPSARTIVPTDHDAICVGRIIHQGIPRPVLLDAMNLRDLSGLAPTMADILDFDAPATLVRNSAGPVLCSLQQAMEESRLLAPCDLQAVKAAGVTFAASALERVIEERSGGDAKAAGKLRERITVQLQGSLASVQPGSPAAENLKSMLIEDGLWSQYLEVAIGPDPEIFTKCQPLSAVGCGSQVGLHPKSKWNNPEPEFVLAVSSARRIVGATLGNDVNLRDFEGRSALLLGHAKDNNASCAIGPFIRLFDDRFSLDDLRSAEMVLTVEGLDGFFERGTGSLAEISRPPEDLVAAAMGPHHQYPDGMMLFLGACIVPQDDRDEEQGFRHLEGDRVTISSPLLGALVNEVTSSDRARPWTFGFRQLMRALAKADAQEQPA